MGTQRSLAHELEEGALRDELYGPSSTPAATHTPAQEPRHVYRVTFSGDGREYFRIWIVNLFLTLITLGVYSAWAKVRKTRYFWQNTRLDNFAFDFHGDPVAILKGRILAVALFVLYSLGLKFSATAGVATVLVIILVGPWLFLRAQQFKLGNTSYRGLRFGFRGSLSASYARFLPFLVVWFASTILSLLTELVAVVTLAFGLTLCLFPLMHHELKNFQHANSIYGDRQFGFYPGRLQFYFTYAKALAFFIPSIMLGGLLVSGLVTLLMKYGSVEPNTTLTLPVMALVGAILYVTVNPYLAARIQKIVWDGTVLPGMRFRTELEAIPLFKISAKNMILTIVSLGLYWPFAAVALARYRLEAFVVESDSPMGAIAASTRIDRGSATGDSAADIFGLDIGL